MHSVFIFGHAKVGGWIIRLFLLKKVFFSRFNKIVHIRFTR